MQIEPGQLSVFTNNKILSLIKYIDCCIERFAMTDLRTSNMEKRRDAILAAARDIIARDGFDALTTRGLAEAAGVTVPTLYNLIGDKAEIVRLMIMQGVERVWSRLKLETRGSPLEMIETIIDESHRELATDPDYFRAATVALDRIGGDYAASGDLDLRVSEAGPRSVAMATEACRAAIEAGLLNGNLTAEVLGEQMFICWRGPMRDWAYGVISAEEARRRQLRGFYLIMAADAAGDFRDELLARAAGLETVAAPAQAA